MHFHERSTLAATPDEVFAILSDESFLGARAEHTGALSHSGSVRTEGSRTVVTSSRTVPTRGLPAAAQKFMGGTAVVNQVETWGPADADGSRDGTFDLTITGAPVEMKATTRISAEGGGTVHDMDGDLTVRVPLVGRSVEQAALPGLLDLIRAEVELARRRLQS